MEFTVYFYDDKDTPGHMTRQTWLETILSGQRRKGKERFALSLRYVECAVAERLDAEPDMLFTIFKHPLENTPSSHMGSTAYSNFIRKPTMISHLRLHMNPHCTIYGNHVKTLITEIRPHIYCKLFGEHSCKV